MATTLGKEIGWRGFCIYELRKVVCFKRVSVLDKLHANLIVHFLMEKIANSHGQCLVCENNLVLGQIKTAEK